MRGILPRVIEEARLALDAEVETLNRPSLAQRLKIARHRGPKISVPEGGWQIGILENTDDDVEPGDIVIYSELALPSKAEFGAGSMTKRIATRRMAGAETTAQKYEPAPAPPPAAGSGQAGACPTCAVIEYEDNGGHKSFEMIKDEIVVGRGGRDYWTDLKLDTLPDVSREHFRLRRDAATGKFFLKDLSRLGTTIDGRKAPSSIEFVDGERRDRNVETEVPPRRGSGWRMYSTSNSEARRMVETKLRCAGASHTGVIRQNNEDAFYMDAERGIFAVVDGLGGQAAGEQAAEIAVARLRARLERQTGTAEQRLREAITMANNEILRTAREHPEWHGMACVLTAVVLENGSAVVGHVGDSRLYHIRGGEIRKITHDHSPVGEREDSQELSEAEAMRHPRRNEVFRDVGSEEHAPGDSDFIEIQRIAFEPDAALILCSDGLSDQVASAEIREAVERHAGDPEAAVEELIEAANRAGGKDNVTVVVVEGERFAAHSPAPAPERAASLFSGRPALFLYGLLLAAAAAWLSRVWWTPPAVIVQPRVLAVGSGARFGSIAAALAQARRGDTVEVAAANTANRCA